MMMDTEGEYSNEPQWCAHQHPLNDGGICCLCGKRVRGTELVSEEESYSIFDNVDRSLGEYE